MSVTTVLPTGTWKVDTATTTVTVTVKKLGLFDIPAALTVSSGVIEINEQNEITNVEVNVDAASYKSKNTKRNEHVISGDFLDAETHPTITFRTGSVLASGGGHRATGTVTVKGRTTPLDVTVGSVDVGADAGSFTATATVDRNSIGVDKMPSFVIGSDLHVAVSASVVRSG